MAIGVGNVLEFIAEAPGAVARCVEPVHAPLKIESEIELGAAGYIHGNWPDGCDKPRRRSDEWLEAMLAAEIQFQSDGADAAAVHRFAAIRAISGYSGRRRACHVFELAQRFERHDVQRVLQRRRGLVVQRAGVAEREDSELAVGGGAEDLGVRERVAAPDAEFIARRIEGSGLRLWLRLPRRLSWI